jgi:hypothetical protein
VGLGRILNETSINFHGESPIISHVHGVEVRAYVIGSGDDTFLAEFTVNGLTYRVQTSDLPAISTGLGEINAKEKITELVNRIILGEPADLSLLENPSIPELRYDNLTLAEARSDARFGMFLPQNIPSDFQFESAIRHINTRNNDLLIHWSYGLNVLSWTVRTPLESDLWNIVSVNEREKYDVSLYTIPWAMSVPNHIHEYFQSPVFLAEEFSLEMIMARTRFVDDGRRGVPSRWETTQFGVLYGDVLIKISATGIAPEDIWKMFEW